MRNYTLATFVVLLQTARFQLLTAFVVQPSSFSRTSHLHQSAIAEVTEAAATKERSVDKLRCVVVMLVTFATEDGMLCVPTDTDSFHSHFIIVFPLFFDGPSRPICIRDI
jgi:hypothetical protein